MGAQDDENYEQELTEVRAWISGRPAQVQGELAKELAQSAEVNQACDEGSPGAMLDMVKRFGFAW